MILIDILALVGGLIAGCIATIYGNAIGLSILPAIITLCSILRIREMES